MIHGRPLKTPVPGFALAAVAHLSQEIPGEHLLNLAQFGRKFHLVENLQIFQGADI